MRKNCMNFKNCNAIYQSTKEIILAKMMSSQIWVKVKFIFNFPELDKVSQFAIMDRNDEEGIIVKDTQVQTHKKYLNFDWFSL